jgi:uncharacterized integral membrane protein (TIGR00697 family)
MEKSNWVKANWLVLIFGMYTTLLVMAPIMSMKVVTVFGLKFAAGALSALFAYALLDIVNELQSKEDARKLVWVGLIVKFLIFVVLVPLVVFLPGIKAESFNTMFAFGLRLFVATEIVNFVQTIWVDIPVFDVLKKYRIGFFVRSNLSNILSWTIAAVLFVFIGYWGTPMFSVALLVGQIVMRYPLTFVYTAITSLMVKYLRS